jgi:hypothetical protein
VVLPGESGCNRKIAGAVSLAWQAAQRAWPGRLARKIGCTLFLKNSKSSEAAFPGGTPAGVAGCWLSKPNNKTQQMPQIVIHSAPIQSKTISAEPNTQPPD